MAQADFENSRHAPRRHRTPLRSYLLDGFLVVFILISAGTAGCLVAHQLDGRIAAHCAADLQRALQ